MVSQKISVQEVVLSNVQKIVLQTSRSFAVVMLQFARQQVTEQKMVAMEFAVKQLQHNLVSSTIVSGAYRNNRNTSVVYQILSCKPLKTVVAAIKCCL